MREICQSGSEGGAGSHIPVPTSVLTLLVSIAVLYRFARHSALNVCAMPRVYDSSPIRTPVPHSASHLSTDKPPHPAAPRRKRRVIRYTLLTLIVASGVILIWRDYTYRKAVRELKGAGFGWVYSDPVDLIREDWRAIFRKNTWDGTFRFLLMNNRTWDEVSRHREAIQRLQPTSVQVYKCAGPARLDLLRGLKDLRVLYLVRSEHSGDLAALGAFTRMQSLYVVECRTVENLDAVTKLTWLKMLCIQDCPGADPDNIARLQAAMPGTKILSGSITFAEMPVP